MAGSLILLARLRAGLTQRDLAGRLGVSQPTIAAYESGRRQPTLPTLMRILGGAGFDLELGVAPHDDHDEVLARREGLRDPEEQARWQSYQRELERAARRRLERAP
ncbi:MAG: helix-turn-helix transcriptional regulator [Acidimicrobiales bacterium]